MKNGNHCKWRLEKSIKDDITEGTRYCEECYRNNNTLLLDPVSTVFPFSDIKATIPDVNHVRSFFLDCKLLRRDSSSRYVITPYGYQFLMKNFRDQALILLQPYLINSGGNVELLSFLFNLRHMIPCRGYDVRKLTEAQQQFLPFACIIGLVYTRTAENGTFFFMTPLGENLFSQDDHSSKNRAYF